MGLLSIFGGSKPQALNTIANLKTVSAQSLDGPITLIVIGLNIPDLQNADSFVKNVAEKFKVQRMCSSPDTSQLLITIISDMPATRLADLWRQLAADDEILSFFMSRMRKAEVLRGTVAGQTLETVSLVHEPSP